MKTGVDPKMEQLLVEMSRYVARNEARIRTLKRALAEAEAKEDEGSTTDATEEEWERAA